MTTPDNSSYPNGSFTNGRYNGEKAANFDGNGPNYRDPDEIDLKQLFYTLWHHKWLISSVVVFFSMLAIVVAYTVTPMYRSEGAMLIKDSGSKLSMAGQDGLASLLSSSYGIGMGSTIGNELQILRSRNISEKMADSLMKQASMANGKQFPILFRGYPDDSTVTTQDTVAMRIREHIAFTQVDREADIVQISYESPSPQEASFIVDLAMKVYMDLSTRQNRRSANSAVGFLENERSLIEKKLNTVEQRLREFMNEEHLVQVDAQTEELIKRMAELEGKKQEARVKLVAINSAVEQYRDRLNNIKPGLASQYTEAIGPQMTRLQYQLAELETEKLLLISNNPAIKDAATPPAEVQRLNDRIKVLRDRIKELTTELIKQSDQYVGFIGGADGDIAQSIREINEKLIELQVEQQQNQAQVEVINNQLEEQQQFFDDLPDNMIELARLKRDVKINEELFLTVSKQYAEMSLWEQTQFGLGRPVDDGYLPEDPVYPNKKLFLLVGFILGGIFGVGFVFIREAFNTSIDGVEKLKKYPYPLLSVIPDKKQIIDKEHGGKKKITISGHAISTNLLTVVDTLSPAAESYRRLSSNIIYSNPDRELKTMMVTSSSKGEGKTTTLSNLGVVLAEAGYSVVLVDTDFRRPNLHNQFGLKLTPGVVEMLFNDVSLQEVLRPTIVEKLSLIAAGNIPPNPANITRSEAFQNLIKELEERFDYVLLDSPPFGIIADSTNLVRRADGIVVVARFGKTDEGQMAHVFENLEQIHANIIGTVLTAFDSTQSTDYNYASGYYRNIHEEYAEYQAR